MITGETDFKKWVLFSDQEAREHDTDFMTSALEQAEQHRGVQYLYGSRCQEDLSDLLARLWQAGKRRDWKQQRDLLITIAALAARNARVAHTLAHPELAVAAPPSPSDRGHESAS